MNFDTQNSICIFYDDYVWFNRCNLRQTHMAQGMTNSRNSNTVYTMTYTMTPILILFSKFKTQGYDDLDTLTSYL